jgi:purine-binding chemotaxis protein CheW
VVLESPVVTRVPKSPVHMRGVINHRGSVVPVVDLRAVFGMDIPESVADSSIIVAQVDFEGELLTAGILADAVQEVVDLEQDSVEPPPSFGSRVDGAFIKGIGKRDGRFVILLDLERALSGTSTGSAASRASDRE